MRAATRHRSLRARYAGQLATAPVEVVEAVLVRFEIFVPANVPLDRTTHAFANSVWSNGFSRNVSAQTVWTSDDPAIVSTSGSQLTGLCVGTTVVHGAYADREAMAPIEVSLPVVLDVTVTPTPR